MLSFGAPGFLMAAVAAAAGVVLLHLLARARRPQPLPTARFLPDPPESAVARARRPADLLLLLLRVLALLLIGAGFARPEWSAARTGARRVVLLDLSRAVADPAAARDSARRWMSERDTLIAFDSAVQLPAAPPENSSAAAHSTRARGSFAAALLAGQRAAHQLARHADSVELVLVSPLAAEEWDAAVPVVRALWPGALRLVRTAAAPPRPDARLEVRAATEDPLRATLALLRAGETGDASGPPASVRLQRGELGADDLAWVRAPERVLVHWPLDDSVRADTIGAVVAGDVVVVAPFARGREPEPGAVLARWADGRPAATERAAGEGCVRDVAITIPVEGDLVLRESVQRLVQRLSEPCGGAGRYEPLDPARIELLAGDGPGSVALPRSAAEAEGDGRLVAACLGAAMAVLLLEQLARRRGGAA